MSEIRISVPGADLAKTGLPVDESGAACFTFGADVDPKAARREAELLVREALTVPDEPPVDVSLKVAVPDVFRPDPEPDAV